MYEDKLDGRITPEQFDRKAKDTRSKQQALRTKISEHQTNGSDLRAGFNMMRLTSIACREFQRQNARERRKLLELVVGGAVWKEGQLDVTFTNRSELWHFRILQVQQNKRRKRLRRLSLRNGSPAWIRTTIHGSKGRCPTIRRPGSMEADCL
jgi:hypothetical protein